MLEILISEQNGNPGEEEKETLGDLVDTRSRFHITAVVASY